MLKGGAPLGQLALVILAISDAAALVHRSDDQANDGHRQNTHDKADIPGHTLSIHLYVPPPSVLGESIARSLHSVKYILLFVVGFLTDAGWADFGISIGAAA